MNIVPVTNIRSMSPKALFSPISGSKLLCDRLQIVGAYDQHKRDADDQRHLEQGEDHGQRLSHDVHGGKRGNRADGHPNVSRGPRHDVRQGLVDLAAIVRIDATLVQFLLPR